MSAVVLSARVVARASARRELLQALLEWAASARREPGVRESSVYEDVETPATFGLIAEWPSAAALEAHLRSDAFGVLLGGLELLAHPATLRVSRPEERYGDDAFRAIRTLREGRRSEGTGRGPA